MRNNRRWILILVALALPVLSCGQCAIGQNIEQHMTIGGDVTCLIMLVVFFVGIIFLIMLPGTFGGLGGGRQG